MDVRARLFVRDEKRDPVLFRTQRIVAWLEENQATKLRREAFESSGVRENAMIDATSHGVLNALDVNCGTFKETALAVEQGATQDFEERELSQRLDMDGIVWQDSKVITQTEDYSRSFRRRHRLLKRGISPYRRETKRNC